MSKSTNNAYDQDFYAWVMHNVNLIRQGRWSELDASNVAEELESMGKREKRELASRIKVLLMHLLKWQYQSEKRSRSWERTIDEQREQLRLILADSPSLKYQLTEQIQEIYPLALKAARKETRLPKHAFPAECPYLLKHLLDENFYPDNDSNR